MQSRKSAQLVAIRNTVGGLTEDHAARLIGQLGLASINKGAYHSAFGWMGDEQNLLESRDPSNEQVIGFVAQARADDLEKIIAGAAKSQQHWRSVPAPRRGDLVRRIGGAIEEVSESLAYLISLETGKPLADARSEIAEAVEMASFAAGQARMLNGSVQQSRKTEHKLLEQWHPLGVVGIITAFNFPISVWARSALIAAVCGNAVVWRPSSKVPLSAIAMQRIVEKVMVEEDIEGVFSLFVSSDSKLAEDLVVDSRLALMTFTGSSVTGRRVNQLVTRTLGRHAILECSGNSASIVDETADIDQAVSAVLHSAMSLSGQRCTATRRLFVQRTIAPLVMNKLKVAIENIKIGDPLLPDTDIGPLCDGAAVAAFLESVSGARRMGGVVEVGGRAIPRPGHFVEPTLISQVRNDWHCVQTETFAPILYVIEFDRIEEAIEMNNDSAYGLSSGLHSNHLRNIELFLSAAGSDCGQARINMGTAGSDPSAAFGGEKESGGGRTSGSDAWKHFMRRQSVCINWGASAPWSHLVS